MKITKINIPLHLKKLRVAFSSPKGLTYIITCTIKSKILALPLLMH